MERSETRIVRSWSKTIGLALGGAASIVIAIYAAWSWSLWSGGSFWKLPEGILALFLLVLGCGLIINAWSSSSRAPCPHCSRLIKSIKARTNVGVLCAGCERFVEGDEGRLWLSAVDRVTDQPAFGAPLAGPIEWPAGCCLCQAPATRAVPISVVVRQTGKNLAASTVGLALTGVGGNGFVQTGGGRRYTLEVPHCAAHDDGAELAESDQEPVKILFRSYAYQRSFCELNKSKPRARESFQI